MASDFFLQNRAHQLCRLCRETPVRFEPPRKTGRSKLPGDLVEFVNLIDRICDSTLPSEKETSGLDEKRRSDLRAFERDLVRLRFSKDVFIKQSAVQLIKAIFADADYFSGLKPLPQYTATFSYERLFPSWLNLLTATMLPQASNGKPRLDGNRQGALFEYLSKVKNSDSEQDELIGLLTFVAARFDAPLCEHLLQRLCDLYERERTSLIDSLNSIEQESKDARQFALRLRDYLTAMHSLHRWPSERMIKISYARPAVRVLPRVIETLLKQSEQQRDWTLFFSVAGCVRKLVESDDFLNADYVELLEQQPANAPELLKLIIRDGEPEHIASDETQRCLAFVVHSELANSQELAWAAISDFAAEIAERLDGASDELFIFFKRHFLMDVKSRQTVLNAVGSETKRRELTTRILGKAQEEEDNHQFLAWLYSAAIMSPGEESAGARQALQAIDGVRQNRSIGNREFADLMTDLQEHVQDSLSILASPIRAVGGKSARLAALYMTLNEISETLAATGKVDNFSVVRAKYARLTNLDLG